MQLLPEDQVYAVVGDDGFRKLVSAFYQQIPNDSLLGPMYPQDDLAGAEARLCSFLIYRFGGPQAYIEERGHPKLRMRHAPFPLNQAARDRWISLMTTALEQTGLPESAAGTLKKFFENVATFLMNQ